MGHESCKSQIAVLEMNGQSVPQRWTSMREGSIVAVALYNIVRYVEQNTTESITFGVSPITKGFRSVDAICRRIVAYRAAGCAVIGSWLLAGVS